MMRNYRPGVVDNYMQANTAFASIGRNFANSRGNLGVASALSMCPKPEGAPRKGIDYGSNGYLNSMCSSRMRPTNVFRLLMWA
jgi:hypothetical protein